MNVHKLVMKTIDFFRVQKEKKTNEKKVKNNNKQTKTINKTNSAHKY